MRDRCSARSHAGYHGLFTKRFLDGNAAYRCIVAITVSGAVDECDSFFAISVAPVLCVASVAWVASVGVRIAVGHLGN